MGFYRAKTRTKGNWKEWQDNPQSPELIEKWKREGLFNSGIAVITGNLWRGPNKGKFLTVIDADNLKAIEEICTRNGVTKRIDDFARVTMVEQHKDNLNKAHFYFLSEERPLVDKTSNSNSISSPRLTNIITSSNDGEEIIKPSFEVKGFRRIVYCSPSFHKGSKFRYEIIGTDTPNVLNILQVRELEQHLDQICRRYGIRYLVDDAASSKTPIQDLFKDEFAIYQGDNRHVELLRVMDSLILRNRGILKIDKIKELAAEWNDQHCIPPVESRHFEAQWIQSINYTSNIVAREEEEQWNNNKLDNNNQGQQQQRFNQRRQQESQSLIETVMNRHIFKTLRDTEEILYYDANDGLYHLRGEQIIKVLLEDLLGDRINDHTRNEIVKHVRYRTIVDRRQFDKDPNVLHFKNGYYNIETNIFKEGQSPDCLSRVVIPHKLR